MKFVKPCPRIPGTHPADTGKLCKALSQDSRHISCGHRQALQSPVPGFPAHILRTPASSAKLCPRVGRGIPPGNCKALSSGFPAHILADTGKLCKALSPGFPAHILRTPASSAKPCPPVTVKQGGMTTAIPCKKKTAVKPPSRILVVFLITYGDSKPEGNSLSCKGTCKGW